MKAILLMLLPLSIFAQLIPLQYQAIEVIHKHSVTEEKVIISRANKECVNVHTLPGVIYGGDIVDPSVPDACKKSVSITAGKLQPISLHPKVKTVGELEVLDFIKNKLNKNSNEYILVDARRIDWFETITIPGAVQISYDSMIYDIDFIEEWNRFLKLLNIQQKDGKINFDNAKNMIIFCNGPWCTQSPRAIKTLLGHGYPPEKINWYRGGIQSWILSGFTTIKPR